MGGYRSILLLLAGVVCCGLLGIALSRSRLARYEPGPRGLFAIDLGLLALLSGIAYLRVSAMHRAVNPAWLACGLDADEYVGLVWHHLRPDFEFVSGYRYPFYPWLSSLVSRVAGTAPAQAAMRISLASTWMIAPAVYLLGRRLAPRGVAFAGALAVLHLSPLLQRLGTPTEYPLCGLFQVLVLASMLGLIHRPGPFAAMRAGAALAGLMAATPKALAALLVAIPFGLVSIGLGLWTGRGSGPRTGLESGPRAGLESGPRTGMRRTLLSVVAFLAPLVLVWGIFARADLLLHTLEHALFKVQEEAAAAEGYRIDPPPGSWEPDTPARDQGSWRIGQLEALRNLPTTLRILSSVPVGMIPERARLSGLHQGLKEAIGLPSLVWFCFLVPGLLAAGIRQPASRQPILRWALGAAFLTVVTVGQLEAGILTVYRARFLLPVLVTLPLLLLAGAALLFRPAFAPGRRGLELAWLPLVLLALGELWLGRGDLSAAVAGRRLLEMREVDPNAGSIRDLLKMRREIGPGEGLVDLTDRHVAWLALGGRVPVVVPHPDAEDGSMLEVPASSWSRRLLIEPCFQHCRWHDVAVWRTLREKLDSDPRFHRVSECVVEDLHPEMALELPGLGG